MSPKKIVNEYPKIVKLDLYKCSVWGSKASMLEDTDRAVARIIQHTAQYRATEWNAIWGEIAIEAGFTGMADVRRQGLGFHVGWGTGELTIERRDLPRS